MRRSARFIMAGAFALSAATFTGCTSGPEPQTSAKRETLSIDSDATIRRMSTTDAGLQDFLDKAYGYAIFPSVGKGGFLVGGSYGRGEVYRGGQHVGYADVTAISAGLLAGGQTISEVLVFATEKPFNEFTRGEWSMGANASVVALKAGAAAGAQFRDGIVVFVDTRGGLMGDLSLEGQKFRYSPRSGASTDSRTASYDEAEAQQARDREQQLRAEQDRESRELQQDQQKAREELRQQQQEKQQELRSEQREAADEAQRDAAEAEVKVDAPPAKADTEKDGPSIRGEVEIGPDAADKKD